MHLYSLLTTILLLGSIIRIFQLKGEVATTDYWRKKANEWKSLQKFTDKNLRGECDMWIAKINDKDAELLKAHADLDNLQLKYEAHVNGVGASKAEKEQTAKECKKIFRKGVVKCGQTETTKGKKK